MSFPQLRSGVLNPLGGTPALTNYVLNAESGSVAWTGTAASLNYGKTVTAASGSFVWTGTAASLLRGYKLAADSGTYLWTGTDANLAQSSTAPALSYGAVPLDRTGYPRAFHPSLRKPIRIAPPAAHLLTAESGAYAWTGTDAGLLSGSKFPGKIVRRRNPPRPFMPGPWQLRSGRATIGSAPTILTHYSLTAEVGSYILTGTAADLLKTWRLDSESGSYVWTGSDVVFDIDQRLMAESGAFDWTGNAATLLLLGPKVSAESGAYVWTGEFANLIWSGASPGSNRRGLRTRGRTRKRG